VAAFVSFGVGSRSKTRTFVFLAVFHKQPFSDFCLLAINSFTPRCEPGWPTPRSGALLELKKRGERKSDSLKGRLNNYRTKSRVSRRCLAAQYFLRRRLVRQLHLLRQRRLRQLYRRSKCEALPKTASATASGFARWPVRSCANWGVRWGSCP
jgi:hypothetical protein